jgi:hypothetical protein
LLALLGVYLWTEDRDEALVALLWMPFNYNTDRSLTMRIYAPKSEVLTGKWNPPPVTRVRGVARRLKLEKQRGKNQTAKSPARSAMEEGKGECIPMQSILASCRWRWAIARSLRYWAVVAHVKEAFEHFKP